MLSMRNGLSLHPMCLPGEQGFMHPSQLSQMGIDFDNVSGSYDINMRNALHTITEPSNFSLNFPSQCTSSARPSLPIAQTIISSSEAMSFGFESCVPANFRPSQLHNASPTVCGERNMPHERLVDYNIETKSLVVQGKVLSEFSVAFRQMLNLGAVTSSTRPFSFGIGDSSVKGYNPIEELMQQKDLPQGSFLENKSGQNQLITSKLCGYNWTRYNLS